MSKIKKRAKRWLVNRNIINDKPRKNKVFNVGNIRNSSPLTMKGYGKGLKKGIKNGSLGSIITGVTGGGSKNKLLGKVHDVGAEVVGFVSPTTAREMRKTRREIQGISDSKIQGLLDDINNTNASYQRQAEDAATNLLNIGSMPKSSATWKAAQKGYSKAKNEADKISKKASEYASRTSSAYDSLSQGLTGDKDITSTFNASQKLIKGGN